RRQRKSRSSASDMASTSRPSHSTRPPVITPGARSRRTRASAMVDLPLPDSPARPNTSPGAMAKETPSTTHRSPPSRRYSTRRSSTASRSGIRPLQHRGGPAPAPAAGPLVARVRAQARVAHLVEGAVDHGQGKADQPHAGAGGDEGPPRAGDQGGV